MKGHVKIINLNRYLEEVAVGEVVVLLLPRRLGDLEVEGVEVREERGVLRMRAPAPRLVLGEEVSPLFDPLQLPRAVTRLLVGEEEVEAAGSNCIKISLPGKMILSKRKGLWEVTFS